MRDENFSEKPAVACCLSSCGCIELPVADLARLPQQCTERVRIVAHSRVHDSARLEIHAAFVSARVRANRELSALPREIEQLEHVVNSDVLKRALDRHQRLSDDASPLYLRATACVGLNFSTRANARAASRVRLRSSSDSPRTTSAAKWYTLA